MRACLVRPKNGGLEIHQSLAHSDEGVQTIDGGQSGTQAHSLRNFILIWSFSVSGDIRQPEQLSFMIPHWGTSLKLTLRISPREKLHRDDLRAQRITESRYARYFTQKIIFLGRIWLYFLKGRVSPKYKLRIRRTQT